MKRYYSDYDMQRDRNWIEQQRDLRNGAMYGSQKAVSGSNLKRYQRTSDMEYPTRADMFSRQSKTTRPRNKASYLYDLYVNSLRG